jgi:hypothetical protein
VTGANHKDAEGHNDNEDHFVEVNKTIKTSENAEKQKLSKDSTILSISAKWCGKLRVLA